MKKWIFIFLAVPALAFGQVVNPWDLDAADISVNGTQYSSLSEAIDALIAGLGGVTNPVEVIAVSTNDTATLHLRMQETGEEFELILNDKAAGWAGGAQINMTDTGGVKRATMKLGDDGVVTFYQSPTVDDTAALGTEIPNLAQVQALISSSPGSSGGSTAKSIYVDNKYLNETYKPFRIPLQDGGGDTDYYYQWDWEEARRLSPEKYSIASAGTLNPVVSASPPFLEDVGVTATNVQLVVAQKIQDTWYPLGSSAVVNISGYTIDNYWTNSRVYATGSVAVVEGEIRLAPYWEVVSGATNGQPYSSGFELEPGSVE